MLRNIAVRTTRASVELNTGCRRSQRIWRRVHGSGGPCPPADAGSSAFSLEPEPDHYRSIIQYDGTNFHGYQSQRSVGSRQDVRTVQDAVEDALTQLNRGNPVRTTAAGRTDKGVHASGQVINFKLPWWQHGNERILRAFNAKLPKDVSAVSLEQVDTNFHSRYSASYRRYRYDILNAPHRLPLLSRYSWHVVQRLNVEEMQAAADILVGTHDFSTFGSPPDDEGHCIREIVSISVNRTPVLGAGPTPFGIHSTSSVADERAQAREASIVAVDIVGRSFLYHMVRNIVGTLKAVGCGKERAEDVRLRLLRRTRDACGQTAPAHALTLTEVGFWGEDGGLLFDDWVASRPQEDMGQRISIGPPKRPPSSKPPTT